MNTPKVNNWYTNLTGQLFKVTMMSYSKDIVSNLLIEYINGDKQIITISDWNQLNLKKEKR